ncbi:MAG: DUF4405 domain-containing protein [Acidobacteria bacterium]|nr:DUF4405 domain-containing protein [Acidobacteriota bacterium]NIM61190.1 DUF4405 domain-containing protein [Acidobacteriota bacterium]NIO58738.1 DUF4405 domain-containing protein [Acidobacteriota bacterium]NIQ84512.1 DUF4405 domain-containing protein [Acidobacteriota bacterium]NIT10470.1 DUF4405 domain-containing protein [Acidobacteriota bacterium]
MRIGPAVAMGLLVGLWVPGALAQGDEDCLACHSEIDLFEGLDDPSRLVVTEEQHLGSLHGSIGLACVDCHMDLAGSDDYPHAEILLPVDCGMCHPDTQELFAGSMHGYALERGDALAPTCASCHGTHDILPASDPDSPTHESRLHEICASCHGAAGVLTNQIVKFPETVASYARSVHGPSNGGGGGATCDDCHHVHEVRGVADPESRIHRANLARTCGGCHEGIRDEYERSIHGRALQAGLHDSPTCTDCHGEHLILSPSDPDSKSHASRQATESCGNCHNDPVIIAKYSLRGDAVGTYVDSYHGWTTRRGYMSAATCVSCHTAHLVLPHTEPQSTIHADNLVQTCGQCHKRADEAFASSYTHEQLSVTANPVNRWIRGIYWVLITGVIGGMVLHNLVILNFHAVRKRRQLGQATTVRRLDHVQLAQHALMALSFIVLTITGFALRYPDAGWVSLLTAIGLDEPLRANVHRIAGVAMLIVALTHVLYVILARRGREEFRAMVPSRRDLREAVDNLRYHTWRRERPADFGRYDYTQKAEYWAIVWGTALMALTGAVLWFPDLAVKLVPAWVVTASQTVHFYEAWLAALAIVVWHFFFVLFHPDVYPMSWTWLSGKVDRRSVEKHHPRWYREELAGEPVAADDD